MVEKIVCENEKCKKYTNTLEFAVSFGLNIIKKYRNKAKVHKKYFEYLWISSLLGLYNFYDFYHFLPFIVLGMISVSYVNSSYLNIPQLCNEITN